MRSSLVRIRSSLVVRASDCQCTSCNGPGFDPSIRRHSGIWGAADEAVLNFVRNKREKIPQKILKKKKKILPGSVTTWTGDLKCREVKTGFSRKKWMQTSSSGTLIWLEIWSSLLFPSPGPIGGSVAMDFGLYAPTLLSRGSVLLYSILLCTNSKNRGDCVYSMNITGGRRKLSITRASAVTWGSSCSATYQHLLKPLFRGKNCLQLRPLGSMSKKPFITMDTADSGHYTLPEIYGVSMVQYSSLLSIRCMQHRHVLVLIFLSIVIKN